MVASIRLVVTAVDHDQRLKIEAFHITYPFQCSHLCGLGHKGMKGELNVESALSEVGAFSRSPWLEVQMLTVTGSFNVVPGMCIESIRGCLWFVGIPHVFCRFLSGFKN